jgi:hypothetical protein
MGPLVWLVMLADTLTIIFNTWSNWQKYASGWGNLAALVELNWPMGSLSVLSGFGMFSAAVGGGPDKLTSDWESVASCVHVFFSWRIFKLQKSIILPVLICSVGGYFPRN